MVRKTKEEAEQTRQQIIHAARRVFFERGVSRSTLDEIAKAAGVTRGAVYWHFADKPDLFFAMCEQCVMPFQSPHVADLLAGKGVDNPLDGVEQALLAIVDMIERDELVRMTLEIIMLRCEYIDEFATVLETLLCSHESLLKALESAYRRAIRRGCMRKSLKADVAAAETLVFICGLSQRWVASPGCRANKLWREMIRAHVAAKRADDLPVPTRKRAVARTRGA